MSTEASVDTDTQAIVAQLLTKDDVLQLLEEIANAKQRLYSDARSEVVWSYSSKLKKVLGAAGTKKNDAEKLQSLQSRIQEYFSSYEFFKLTLAFTPEERFLTELKKEILARHGFSPILEIAINPDIVGGVLIDYKGLHFDFSLRHKIDEYLIANKDVLLSKL